MSRRIGGTNTPFCSNTEEEEESNKNYMRATA